MQNVFIPLIPEKCQVFLPNRFSLNTWISTQPFSVFSSFHEAETSYVIVDVSKTNFRF